MVRREAEAPDGAASSEAVLRDIVKRRGVRRVAYFHCDHFEPWRGGGPAIEDYAANVLRFADCSAANEFARRLTLFYKPQVVIARAGTKGFIAATPGDSLGFRPRTAKQETIYAGAMRGLLDRSGHEIQVHLHHEGYTYNTSHRDPEIIELLERPEARGGDAARFELGLNLALDAIRRETGLALERWFFVHGLWALNASDPAVCHITNEIEILMRNGCLGDFTFPAGRPKVDPFLEQPHFVRPVDAPHRLQSWRGRAGDGVWERGRGAIEVLHLGVEDPPQRLFSRLLFGPCAPGFGGSGLVRRPDFRRLVRRGRDALFQDPLPLDAFQLWPRGRCRRLSPRAPGRTPIDGRRLRRRLRGRRLDRVLDRRRSL